jgi:hypothetical protein
MTLAGMRRMFIVDQTMAVEGGFTPCLVIEGDSYRYPMMGNHELARPWVWGPTIEMAKSQARAANKDMGLTEEDETEILRSVNDVASVARDGEEAMRIMNQAVDNDKAASERQRAGWDSE